MKDELIKRGLTFREACMLEEAIYSSAIEGAKVPQTANELDELVEMIKMRDTK